MTRYHELKSTSIYSELEEKKASYIVMKLGEFVINKGTMLDIGSSNGRLMLSALKQGWSTHGIEANADLVADCLAQQLQVKQGFFPDDMPRHWAEFDLITMLDVLEHVERPIEFLEKVQGLLKPNGLVVIQVPNFNSLIIRLEGAKDSNFCHGHWTYYEPATLDRVMQKAGFVKLFSETIISELDRILQFEEMQVMATIKEITGRELVSLDQLTVEYLHQNSLGYKVLAIYRTP
jgi:2-polyprenyl-3-methyl-5-hydroxy-6-metoxy-1,4-benzoquinol methylase